jgi:cell division protein FtsI (penicillin-binding protein 3)
MTEVRCLVSSILLVVAMTGLGVRLAFLHLGPHGTERTQMDRARSIEKRIIADRGSIYDRMGRRNLLSMNLPVQDVCADPQFLMKSNLTQQVASVLARELDTTPDEVARRLTRGDKRFAYVQRFVDETRAQEIRKQKLPGIFFRENTVRYYPLTSFMSHVLGFVNHEAVGSAGIEQMLDDYLKGCSGLLESRVDALRRELYTERDRWVPALRGADVFLTLDQNVQYIVEQALDEAVSKHSAKGAWAIVQRVRTGEILAMASRPTYDLNRFRDADEKDRLNRSIGYVYEPGSTFKAAIVAAALNEGVVSPDDVFDCENGAWSYGGKILRDYHPYGSLTVADGVKKSSNILTAKVALKLGSEREYRYLRSFGIGRPLGLDLPGEEGGILHPVSKWSMISPTRIAIGQGVSVTALQMLGILCCLANGGALMRPYVTSQVVANDGTVLLKRHPEKIAQVVSPETARLMCKLLRRVTEQDGTGWRARVEGYEVAGKTGTAQKPVGGKYSSSAYMSSFVGFLPVERPEIGIIVVVDEPQPLHTGGVVAAPVFGRIAGQAVRYLEVPPDREISPTPHPDMILVQKTPLTDDDDPSLITE